MNLNKYFNKFGKFYLLLFTIIIVAFLYFFNNQFKLIEGNKLKKKGKNEGAAKSESEVPYIITNEVLPPSDHVTQGASIGKF